MQQIAQDAILTLMVRILEGISKKSLKKGEIVGLEVSAQSAHIVSFFGLIALFNFQLRKQGHIGRKESRGRDRR